jgi:hypothetical protein
MRVVSLIAFAVALSLALVSAPARADDTTPPVISYTPPAGNTAPKGAFTVTAKVTDESKCYPQVFFRYGAGGPYEKAIDMRKSTKGKDLYEAIIPYKTEKIEFYVEAYDDFGNGPGRAGDPDSPFRISMGDKAAPAPSASAAPSKPAAKTSSSAPATSTRPAPAAAVASSGGGGGGGRVWTWVTGGVGVGLLTGGVLAGLAVKAQDDAYKKALAGSTGPTGSTTTANTEALNAQNDANKALGMKATILTIAGGVLLAGSVGLWFLETPSEPEPVKKPGVGGDAVWGQNQPAEPQKSGIVIGAMPVEGGGAAVIAGRF